MSAEESTVLDFLRDLIIDVADLDETDAALPPEILFRIYRVKLDRPMLMFLERVRTGQLDIELAEATADNTLQRYHAGLLRGADSVALLHSTAREHAKTDLRMRGITVSTTLPQPREIGFEAAQHIRRYYSALSLLYCLARSPDETYVHNALNLSLGDLLLKAAPVLRRLTHAYADLDWAVEVR